MLPKIKTSIPGPLSKKLALKLRKYESRNITFVSKGFPVFWSKAKNANIWDVDGNRYVDFTSAFGVATLGHTNPQITGDLRLQSRDLVHAMGDVHPSELKVTLCQKLSEITFEKWTRRSNSKIHGKTILCNSGFEAVEAALKTAHLLTGKKRVLAFSGSYHGLGFGALDVTGWPEFRSPFKKIIADFADFLPYPQGHHCSIGKKPAYSTNDFMNEFFKKIERLLKKSLTGAIIVEPIQGRGGEVIPPVWFLPLLRTMADKYQIPLIFDEIYTGFNRTGSFFACEDCDGQTVVPDMICLGKSLTGGLPLSACVGKAPLMDQAWPESTGEALHTSTFLGNPIACAMALKSITLHRDPVILKQIAHTAELLRDSMTKINELSFTGDVRGKGLMWGIEIVNEKGTPAPSKAVEIMMEGLQKGYILLNGGLKHNVISLSPPYNIHPQALTGFSEFLKGI